LRQFLPASRAAAGYDAASAGSAHASAKTMFVFARALFRLPGAFHRNFPSVKFKSRRISRFLARRHDLFGFFIKRVVITPLKRTQFSMALFCQQAASQLVKNF
jgi:hypothetical protein